MTQCRAAFKAFFCSRSTSVGAAHGAHNSDGSLPAANEKAAADRAPVRFGSVRFMLPGPQQRPGHLSRRCTSLLRERTEAAVLFPARLLSLGPTGLGRLCISVHSHVSFRDGV